MTTSHLVGCCLQAMQRHRIAVWAHLRALKLLDVDEYDYRDRQDRYNHALSVSLYMCHRFQEAKERLNTLVFSLRGKPEMSSEEVRYFLDYGNVLCEMQEWDEAREVFQQVLDDRIAKSRDNKIALYYILGNILQHLGCFVDAQEEYSQVDKLRQEDSTEGSDAKSSLDESYERCLLHEDVIQLFIDIVSARAIRLRFIFPDGIGDPEDFTRQIVEKASEIESSSHEAIVYIEGLPIPWAYALLARAISKSRAVVVYMEDEKYIVIASCDKHLPIGSTLDIIRNSLYHGEH